MGIRVRVRLTAADSDVLSGTQLQNKGPGLYKVWAVSTVDTATITVKTAAVTVADAAPIDESATDVAIKRSDNAPFEIHVPAGETQPSIAVGGTTGTVLVEVQKQGT